MKESHRHFFSRETACDPNGMTEPNRDDQETAVLSTGTHFPYYILYINCFSVVVQHRKNRRSVAKFNVCTTSGSKLKADCRRRFVSTDAGSKQTTPEQTAIYSLGRVFVD